MCQAKGIQAPTPETAVRGATEHQTLHQWVSHVKDMEGTLARAREQGAIIPEREVAAVLRGDRGRREKSPKPGDGEWRTSTMARLLSVRRPADAPPAESAQPRRPSSSPEKLGTIRGLQPVGRAA